MKQVLLNQILILASDYFSVTVDCLLGIDIPEKDSRVLFPNRLNELRKKKKLTQVEMAKLLMVTQGAYQKWEAGSREPSFEMLMRIADILEVTIDFLLGRVDVVSLKYDYELVNLESIGERLRFLRKTKNVTQEEVSKCLSIGQGTYSRWEKGTLEPCLNHVVKLSKYFGITTDEILGAR
ncbi:helix-turn-helix transcriptional regulator [Streptococcus parauberis]|uniref:helix-turn-helix domain-containing protein n=1 Tax=Streptococcus parauberis TaxID=1348 RepID=UPI0028923299|nr:helix-turn-helix transcriptional regulator [Streptococcus parauberis]MDT2749608.1 helix-turn-helix transcriptional regulator [Streptococcus parauberis]